MGIRPITIPIHLDVETAKTPTQVVISLWMFLTLVEATTRQESGEGAWMVFLSGWTCIPASGHG